MSNQPTADAAAMLDEFRDDLTSLLADSGLSFDRLRSTFMIAVQQEPDILKCTPESIRREISKCAADGLVPDSKEAVLLAYFETDRKTNEKRYVANYQPMVYGIIKRMRELGGVFQIVCRLVRENDDFVLDEANPDSLSHKSKPFASKETRGPVVGGYVIFRDEHLRVMHLETMSAEDFDQVREASKAPNSPAWTKWEDEMKKKAVLRRGSKYISIDNDKIRRLLERQDSMFDFQNNPRQVERFNPFAAGTIEGTGMAALPSSGQQPMEKIVGKPEADFAQTTSDKREHPKLHARPDASPRKDDQKKPLADKPDTLPDVMIPPKDIDLLTEAASKILGVATDEGRGPEDRRANLKQVAVNWQEAIPDHARDFVRALIAAVDWTIQRDSLSLPWATELSLTIHEAKEALGVDKLDLAKYPAPESTVQSDA
ncbi:RecT family recombinase [Shinella sp. JR1-6]|uniref:RecT family recombinase n=1 Tax=Shinella sp. JR1-6 TaxID=2527671 RepID=UPI001404CA3F|nr:RecT family recombinase [Shinella sp. JR1-6]